METAIKQTVKKFIGVTLMFYVEENKMYKAEQSSFILELTDYKSFKKDINELSQNLIQTEFVGYTYSGITDLYLSEEEGYGNYLGKSTYFDSKSFLEAKEFILSDFELENTIKKSKTSNKFNIGLVYFNADSEGPEFYSTMIIYSQLTNIKNINDLNCFADNPLFKEKVIKFSVVQLFLNDLKYVGISNFYEIKGKGLFNLFCYFETLEEIKLELIKNKNLENRFNEVLKDYEFVNL